MYKHAMHITCTCTFSYHKFPHLMRFEFINSCALTHIQVQVHGGAHILLINATWCTCTCKCIIMVQCQCIDEEYVSSTKYNVTNVLTHMHIYSTESKNIKYIYIHVYTCINKPSPRAATIATFTLGRSSCACNFFRGGIFCTSAVLVTAPELLGDDC